MRKIVLFLLVVLIMLGTLVGCQSGDNSNNDLEDLQISEDEKNIENIGDKEGKKQTVDALVALNDTSNNEREEEMPEKNEDKVSKELTKKDAKPEVNAEPKEIPSAKTDPPAERPKETPPVKTNPPAEKPKATPPVKTDIPTEKPKETPKPEEPEKPKETPKPKEPEKPKETPKPEEPSVPTKPSGRDTAMEKYLMSTPIMQIKKGPNYTKDKGEKLSVFNDYLVKLGKGAISPDSAKNSIKKMVWTERNYASSNPEDMWEYSIYRVHTCRFETKNTDKSKIAAELVDKIWEGGSSYSGAYVYWDDAKSSYTVAAITISINE